MVLNKLVFKEKHKIRSFPGSFVIRLCLETEDFPAPAFVTMVMLPARKYPIFKGKERPASFHLAISIDGEIDKDITIFLGRNGWKIKSPKQ